MILHTTITLLRLVPVSAIEDPALAANPPSARKLYPALALSFLQDRIYNCANKGARLLKGRFVCLV